MPDRSRHLAAALAVALLAGCALPGPHEEPARLDHLALGPLPAPATTAAEWPAETWWQAYGDPQLDRLMAEALAASPDLALAAARLAEARAAAGLARGNAAPQLNADASASRGRQSGNYIVPPPPLGPGGEYITQGLATLGLSWELDFWGRNAALVRAAQGQARAAGHELAAARLALSTAVARTYAQLAAQHELRDIAAATLKQRRAIAGLTRQRVAAGLDTAVEVRQAETGTAALEAELVQLDTAIAVSRLQLAALAGAQPETAVTLVRPQLRTPPFNLPADLPLDLLARRPEIAAQRARLEAAREEATAARAAFYPNVNLAALIGYQAIGLGHLFQAASLTNSVGPAIHLPLFDGGRRQAGVEARSAGLDAAVAQYNQSVLAAARETVEQLTRAAALEREEAATGAALAAAREAYRLALLRYREGLNSYLTVLAVENQLLAQQRAAADLAARRLDLQISLVRALGGGFAARPDPSSLAHAQP